MLTRLRAVFVKRGLGGDALIPQACPSLSHQKEYGFLTGLGKGSSPVRLAVQLKCPCPEYYGMRGHQYKVATIGSVACPPSILEAVVSGRSGGHASPLSWASAGAYYNETLSFCHSIRNVWCGVGVLLSMTDGSTTPMATWTF
jgi:hypothetical protein